MFAPFAKYYESSLDKNEECLLLENMILRGYKTINHRASLNYTHMALLIESLGKFHALSFALRELKPELFKEIGRNTRESFYSNCKEYVTSTNNLAQRILDILEKDSRAYKVFENFAKDSSFVLRETMKPEIAGKYAVVCHGDFQTRNCLFKYEDKSNPDTPTGLCLLDWQLTRFCLPSSDLSELLWTCSDKKLRDDHYEEFLEMYYNSFSSFLKELGGNPENSYPHSVFKEDVKKFSVGGLYLTIWQMLSNSMEIKSVPNLVLVETGKDLVDMFSAAVNDTYLSKMKDAIEDFIEYGYDLKPNILLS
ncbi:hypothetical protein FQR65_LT00909 [Abscondita terminalis]|nr:hypothetical protein FQR65_LT00909 [Abscondita terminalis]